MNHLLKKLCACVFSFSLAATGFAQFTAGNLVVLVAGDGSAPLTNTGNQLFLKEFTPMGAPGFSVAVPASANALIISGSASAEGGLSLSANGKYLVFGGYAQALPNATALSGSSAPAINRGIGRVDAAGNYSRVATSTSFFTGNSIRGAASDGNNNYWAAGASNGTDYFGVNTPAATVQNSITNSRCIAVCNGKLYFSCGAGTQGIYKAGQGLPFTPGQGASLIISTAGTGTGSASPYGFCFDAAQTICYVADERTPANGGGLQKWVYSAGSWTLAYTLGTGAAYGARGVVADFSGTNPKVYATTSEGSINRLVAIDDAGAQSTATTLATSVANGIFRGLAFSPFCSDPQISSIGSPGPACAGQPLSFTAGISGPGPFTYTWSGPGGFSSTAQNPVLANPASGTYSLNVNNACGAANASASITVNVVPVIALSSVTICTGGTVSLTASGAATYTWSDGSNAAGIVVSPITNTAYVVTAASSEGCINFATASVEVVSSLSLSATSATVCQGVFTVLNASGAASYTWSTGNVAATITLTPAADVTYTVTGSAPGCTAAATATAMVTVNLLPQLTANSDTVCFGNTALLMANGASTYSWSTAATGSVTSVTPTASTVYTVTGFSLQGCVAQAFAVVEVNACTSIYEHGLNRSVKVYPNPAKDKVWIDLEDAGGYCEMELYNAAGQKCGTQNAVNGKPVLDVAALLPGIYFLKIKTDRYAVLRKFIKE